MPFPLAFNDLLQSILGSPTDFSLSQVKPESDGKWLSPAGVFSAAR